MPKKIPNRAKIRSPEGVNAVLHKSKSIGFCKRCHQIPSISFDNVSEKDTVTRKINYSLRCTCGNCITGSSLDNVVDAWNTRYSVGYTRNKIYVTDDPFTSYEEDKNKFFN